jgi:hypothetical protein
MARMRRILASGVVAAIGITTVWSGTAIAAGHRHPTAKLPAKAAANADGTLRAAGGPGTHGFVVRCGLSKSAPVDPIVMPGMAGMSHNHEFFGNTTTDENSTGDSLLAGSTTCSDRHDTSAYWVPTLYDNGVRVAATHVNVHYYFGKAASVTAFPAGFKAVSGRTSQTAGWACVARTGGPVWSADVATVPTCGAGAHLMGRVIFPQCWDGTNLDSTDHISHLAFAVRGVCPTDHPVRVPQLKIDVHFPAGVNGSSVTLASGAASTWHADAFEAWQGTSLANRINATLAKPGHHRVGPPPAGPRGPVGPPPPARAPRVPTPI